MYLGSEKNNSHFEIMAAGIKSHDMVLLKNGIVNGRAVLCNIVFYINVIQLVKTDI